MCDSKDAFEIVTVHGNSFRTEYSTRSLRSGGFACTGCKQRQEEARQGNSCGQGRQPAPATSATIKLTQPAAAADLAVSTGKLASAVAPEAFPSLSAAAGQGGGRRAAARRITPTPSRPQPPQPPPAQHTATSFSAPSWQPQAPAWPAAAVSGLAQSPVPNGTSTFSTASLGAPPETPQASHRRISPFTTTVAVGAPPDELVPSSPGLAVSPQITNLERLFSGADVGDRTSPATRRANGRLPFDGARHAASSASQRVKGLKEGQQDLSTGLKQREREGAPDARTAATRRAAALPAAAAGAGSPPAAPKPRHRIRPQPVQVVPPAVPAPLWGQPGFLEHPPPSMSPTATRPMHGGNLAAAELSSSLPLDDGGLSPAHSPKSDVSSSRASRRAPTAAGPAISGSERAGLAAALGRLHGGLLLRGGASALAPEVELVLRLLALPPGCEAPCGTTPLLCDTASAALFAASSLMSAGAAQTHPLPAVHLVMGRGDDVCTWDEHLLCNSRQRQSGARHLQHLRGAQPVVLIHRWCQSGWCLLAGRVLESLGRGILRNLAGAPAVLEHTPELKGRVKVRSAQPSDLSIRLEASGFGRPGKQAR